MIVSFSVSNFRSFAGEQTLSMVASKRMADGHSTHLAAIPKIDESVLRAGVVYGPNGAGKSNLVKALWFLKFVALGRSTKDKGTGRQAFRFGAGSDELTTFDLHFLTEGRLFRFGVKLDDKFVREEWLSEVIGKRESLVFERVTNADGTETEVRAPGVKKPSDKLRALVTIGAPANKSFLGNVLAQMTRKDAPDSLRLAIDWFGGKLYVQAAGTPEPSLPAELAKLPELCEFLGQILRDASTGVSKLTIKRTPLSEEQLSHIAQRYNSAPPLDLGPEEEVAFIDEGGVSFVIERGADGRFYQVQVDAHHPYDTTEAAALPLREESDGTRRLLDLAPVLFRAMKNDAVFVIDEIERNMHPNLVVKFVEFFLKTCTATNRQIIMTTHDVGLLDQDLIRRDEVWFAEKDAKGATNLYSLADFNVRKDLHLRNNYLQGRFGAVPNLDNLGIDEAVAG